MKKVILSTLMFIISVGICDVEEYVDNKAVPLLRVFSES